MATDNNNSLAAETDSPTDESTAELEVLSMDLIPTEEELEMDAKTFSLDLGDEDADSISGLQSDLRSKDERISNLQFDIEQLRARWAGLEKEIAAREELTEILQADLKSANQAMAAKDELLSSNETELSTLTGKLADALESASAAEEQIAQLERQLKKLENESKRDSKTVGELRQQLKAAEDALPPPNDTRDEIIAESRLAIAELNAYIDGRKAEWDKQSAELETLTHKLAENDSVNEKQSEALSAAKATLKDANATNTRLGSELKTANAKLKSQSEDLRKLTSELEQLKERELSAAEAHIAKQRGKLANGRQKIAALESHVERADRYADELRDKLCASFETADAVRTQNQKLEQCIGDYESTVQDLQERLAAERDRIRNLETTNDVLGQDLDSKTRRLRAELDDAHKKAAEQESANRKLNAELSENKAFKKVLEDQLTTYEEAHSTELRELRDQVAKLQTELNESQRKIAAKDKAVTALLSELASKSKTIESIDEIENAIHDIDDRMSKRIDDRGGSDRDRPTRLLVGDIEGQKLRFPLFKDRLTIGRTVQNDIQIRAQFISRRHAVVVTDQDGTKIVDWGSKNGIFVNKKRVSEQRLESGDTVTIGAAKFKYEELPRRPAE